MQKDRKKNISKAGVALLAGIAGVALLLVGCNKGGAGIFYTLEKATAQTTSGIGDSRTIGSGTFVSGSPGVYYVAAGTVYAAVSSASPTWETITAPATNSAGNPYISTSVASSGTTLYAVYYDPNADTPVSYLYSAPVTSTSTVDQNPSWSIVSGFGASASFTVESVYAVGSSIFAVVMENNPSSGAGPYDLWEIVGPGISIPTQMPNPLSGLQDPPSAAAYNSTSGTYWFIGGDNSGPQIYYNAAPAGSSDPTTLTFSIMPNLPSLSTGQVYRSIYYSSTLNTVFASTSPVNNVPGGVYASQAGGAWTSNSIISWPSGTTQTGLNGFDEYLLSSTSDALLVGADTEGYYEIDVNPTTFSASSANTSPIGLGQPGNTTTETAGPDYVSATLASAHVIGFFNVPAPATPGAAASGTDQIFALTQNGLWLNQFPSGSTQRTWTLQ